MHVALITESAAPGALGAGAAGGWCRWLVGALPEHRFRTYVVPGLRPPVRARRRAGFPRRAAPGGRGVPAHPGAANVLPEGGWRRRQAPPRGRLREASLEAYGELVRSLLHPRAEAAFGPALLALARSAREGGGLPALLRSAEACRLLERIWQAPGAATAVMGPCVRDTLAAAGLLERCLLPLSAPWYGPARPAGARTADPGGPGPGAAGLAGAELAGADLCHVVGGGPAALPALIARHLHGVPYVVTEPDPWLREQYLAPGPAACGAPVRALLLAFLRLLARETYRQAAVLLPGSDYARGWQERCGADPERVRVLYGALPDAGQRPPVPEPEVPTLSWTALTDADDPEPVLRAFARVLRAVPDARLRLHLRSPSERSRDRCHRLAAELGLPDTGPVPAVSLHGPPLSPGWADGSGSVVVVAARSVPRTRQLAEAMLSGRPVVCTDAGVAREVLGPAGILVPPGDAEALADACVTLLRDAPRRARLGTAGRLRAGELFTAETAAEALRDAYLEAVSRWSGPPSAVSGDGTPQPFVRPAEYRLAVPGGGGAGGREGGPAAAGYRRLPEAV